MTQTAKNYAQALFELHVDAESVKTTEEILKTVPEVGRSLTNPTISFRVKEQIIGRIFPGEMRNFIKVVCRNQKADMLEEIFQAYREIERKQSKALEATLLYVTAPTKEQQEKLASYFGVSLFYLRGESNDRTRQEDWMSEGYSGADEEPVYRPAPAPKKMKAEAPAQGATMLDALFGGRQAREQFRAMVLEVLRSPEGQEVVAQAVWKELAKRK